MDPLLASLLLDLTDLSDGDAKQLVFDKYVQLYLDSGSTPRRKGTRLTHDGSTCLFTESRFKHAFFCKGRLSKDKFDKFRGVCVAWIGQIIAGKIPKTQCWLVLPKYDLRRPPTLPWNRLYVLRKECFVVWLEPTMTNAGDHARSSQSRWWFSSACPAGYGDIRRYCRHGVLIWQKNIP